MNYTLRPWELSDLESLLKYAGNPKIAGNMTDAFPHPYTREAGIAFLEKVSAASPVNVMAIEIDGEAVGGIGIFPETDIRRMNAEMGYWLGEPFWGKGIMTRAIKEMAGYGFSTWNISRIFARPFGSNTASQKALEKAGFVLEGRFDGTIIKNGKIEDELFYAIRK